MAVRTLSLAPLAGYCRHQEWMSSETPVWTLMIDGSCVHDAMTNSQFPAVGVPDPPPTLDPASSWITHDWSAEVIVVNVVPWPTLPLHWFVTETNDDHRHQVSRYG